MSNNPNIKFERGKGRPPGTGYKQKLMEEMVLPHKHTIVQRILDMAAEGDKDMLKFLGDRLLLRPQDNSINFKIAANSTEKDLASTNEDIMRQVSEGKMLPAEGVIASTMLKNHKDILGTKDIEDKINALSAQLEVLTQSLKLGK